MGELLFIIFGALLVATVVLAPFCAAETRPEFLRPDLRHRQRWIGPMSSPDGDR
jgi:hypothetical protein